MTTPSLLLFALSAPAWAGPPTWLGDAETGVGHCDPSERALFSCETKGGKHLSLCTDDGLAQLQYRFGLPETPDLRAPASSDPKAFTWAHVAWARGEEHSVSFTNAGHVYKVVSASGSGIDGPANNYTGVKVIKDDKELAFVQCVKVPDADHLSQLEGLLPKPLPAEPAPE